MIARNYSVRVLNRGEDLLYSDAEGELQLQQTYFDGHRLYCKDTSGDGFGPPIPFERRKRLIENLCDHFDTRHRTSIFVLGSRDKDRDRLEALFEELRELGHRIIVEHDGARGRKASGIDAYGGVLGCGRYRGGAHSGRPCRRRRLGRNGLGGGRSGYRCHFRDMRVATNEAMEQLVPVRLSIEPCNRGGRSRRYWRRGGNRSRRFAGQYGIQR